MTPPDSASSHHGGNGNGSGVAGGVVDFTGAASIMNPGRVSAASAAAASASWYAAAATSDHAAAAAAASHLNGVMGGNLGGINGGIISANPRSSMNAVSAAAAAAAAASSLGLNSSSGASAPVSADHAASAYFDPHAHQRLLTASHPPQIPSPNSPPTACPPPGVGSAYFRSPHVKSAAVSIAPYPPY